MGAVVGQLHVDAAGTGAQCPRLQLSSRSFSSPADLLQASDPARPDITTHSKRARERGQDNAHNFPGCTPFPRTITRSCHEGWWMGNPTHLSFHWCLCSPTLPWAWAQPSSSTSSFPFPSSQSSDDLVAAYGSEGNPFFPVCKVTSR